MIETRLMAAEGLKGPRDRMTVKELRAYAGVEDETTVRRWLAAARKATKEPDLPAQNRALGITKEGGAYSIPLESIREHVRFAKGYPKSEQDGEPSVEAPAEPEAAAVPPSAPRFAQGYSVAQNGFTSGWEDAMSAYIDEVRGRAYAEGKAAGMEQVLERFPTAM